MMMFLTDGAPTAGVIDQNVIINTVEFVAVQNNININTIGFGKEADHEFLVQLSARSGGMVLRVPIRPDAAFLMQEFYFDTLSKLQKQTANSQVEFMLIDSTGEEYESMVYEEMSMISVHDEVSASSVIKH